MSLDQSGVNLGTLIANALNLPPAPVNPTPEQEAAYLAAQAQQLATWITIAQQIIVYLVANTQVATTSTINTNNSNEELASVIAPSGGGHCTGTLTGTGTGKGIGTIS
jgi:hypothetical protein